MGQKIKCFKCDSKYFEIEETNEILWIICKNCRTVQVYILSNDTNNTSKENK